MYWIWSGGMSFGLGKYSIQTGIIIRVYAPNVGIVLCIEKGLEKEFPLSLWMLSNEGGLYKKNPP